MFNSASYVLHSSGSNRIIQPLCALLVQRHSMIRRQFIYKRWKFFVEVVAACYFGCDGLQVEEKIASLAVDFLLSV